jgi:hypothetical protein
MLKKKYTKGELLDLVRKYKLKGYSKKTVHELCVMLHKHVVGDAPMKSPTKKTKHYRYNLEKKTATELEDILIKLKIGSFPEVKNKYADEPYRYKHFLIEKIIAKQFPLVPVDTHVSQKTMNSIQLFRKRLLQKIYEKKPPTMIRYTYTDATTYKRYAKRKPLEYLRDPRDAFLADKVSATFKGYTNMVSRFRKLVGTDIDGIQTTEVWRQQQLEYQMALPYIDRILLLTYTYGGDAMIHTYLDGVFTIEKMYDMNYITHYVFPLYPTVLKLASLHFDDFVAFCMKYKRETVSQTSLMKTLSNLRIRRTMSVDHKSQVYNMYEETVRFFFSPENGMYAFTADFYTTLVRRYSSHLRGLILRSPKLTHQLIVYKGVKDMAYLDFSRGNMYVNKRFVSTTIDPAVSNKPSFTKANCCLQKIYLLPRTTCLYVYITYFLEHEIILPPGRYMYGLTRAYTSNYKKTTMNLIITN